MSAAPVEAEMEERARRIVETTIELAEQGGFEAVRLRDVASHAGVALGTLYRRFSSKEDLLVAALELETRGLAERVRKRPPRGHSRAERVDAFFVVSTHGMIKRANLSRAMLRAAASGEPALAKKVGEFHTSMQRMIVGALRGESIGPDSAPLTEHETLLGDVLQHVWFALMVGWASGLDSQATVREKMRASVELVLEGANGNQSEIDPSRSQSKEAEERA